MKPFCFYFLTRFLLISLISALFAWSGLPWWIAAFVFILGASFFVWAPISGRYRVVSGYRGIPLRLDERGRQVRDRAGRNAFVITQILFLGLYLYGHFQEPPTISVTAIGISLAAGMLAFMVLSFVYEFWPHRKPNQTVSR